MWMYEKKLQYPIKIKNTNPALAKMIITQYGGPDGELGASLRYLTQRFSMPYPQLKAILTDIGTEELEHRCYKLKKNLYTTAIRYFRVQHYFKIIRRIVPSTAFVFCIYYLF